MRSRIEVLASVPLLQGAGPEVVARLAERCVEREYSRGETVFVEGDRVQGLLVVQRGAVKVFKIGNGGRELILDVEGPGSSVAELPLLDGGPYPASCAAVEDSLLLVVPADAFRRLLDEDRDLSRCVLRVVAGRMRHLVSLLEEISLKEVRGRLAGLLVDMAGDGDTVELTLNNQELAARIGTVREIVSRTFRRMTHEGAIRVKGRRVTLVDRARL